MAERLSKKRKALLRVLESTIGECYNPHSTTQTSIAWTDTYTIEKGRWFNYPVTYIGKDGSKTKNPYFVDPDFYEDGDESVLMNAYYAFGANQLLIYRNLEKILEFLESECGLEIDRYEPDKPSRKDSHSE